MIMYVKKNIKKMGYKRKNHCEVPTLPLHRYRMENTLSSGFHIYFQLVFSLFSVFCDLVKKIDSNRMENTLPSGFQSVQCILRSQERENEHHESIFIVLFIGKK